MEHQLRDINRPCALASRCRAQNRTWNARAPDIAQTCELTYGLYARPGRVLLPFAAEQIAEELRAACFGEFSIGYHSCAVGDGRSAAEVARDAQQKLKLFAGRQTAC